jgi:multidrug resistance protein MdtO
MASPAGDRRAGLLELLAPAPGRLDFSLRLALICSLTILVVEYYRDPEPALTAYVAFFMVKPDRATSILLGVVFVLLISVVLGGLLLVVRVVINDPVSRVGAMTVLSFGLLFAASASKLKPVAPIVALIAAYALDLMARVEIGEVATRALLYAWLFIGIPAGVTIVVNLLVGPPPRRLAGQALADRLRRAAAALRRPGERTRSALAAPLEEGPGEIPAWLRLSGLEKTSPPQDLAALTQAAASTTEILLLVELALHDPQAALPREVRLPIAEQLDEMARILAAGGYPVAVEAPPAAGEEDLPPLAAAVLADLRRALAGFAEPPPPAPPKEAPAKPPGGFWLPDAFTNHEHVRYALKTTGAAMFCYVVYSLLVWPGIHTCLITCYIVSLGTAAETIEKLSLRVLGCLLGAAAGFAAILYVTPHLTTIWGLLALVFPAAFVSAWVAGGSPRISYAGFQLAFAFFLSVIQGAQPAFDMTIARDRTIGILFGDLVVFVLFTQVWTVSVARRIDPALAGLLRKLGQAAAGPAAAASLIGVQAQRAAVDQDLELAHYEPARLRPSPGWLGGRRRALEELAALEGPLLLSATHDPALAKTTGARLVAIADGLGGAAADAEARAPARPSPAARRVAPLRALVEAHVAELERALAPEVLGADHAPA